LSEPVALRPVPFSALKGWAGDDHGSAFRAFLQSCRQSCRTVPQSDAGAADALALGAAIDGETARAFFETHFEPQRVIAETPGFVTGYYEPELRGSRTRKSRFPVPVYGRPDDLISSVPESERARFNDRVTGFRSTPRGDVPYCTRAEIHAGALAGRGLELLYVEDAVELFYMQVQGSGLVHIEGGGRFRLVYAGKNGHPYTSIARLLIEGNELAADEIDMDTVKAWLRADTIRGAELMRKNESYVFFREVEDLEGPLGAEGVPLTPGRSLALDTAYHALGTPVFVSGIGPEGPEALRFRRLMIAQDVGSAIAGPQRGDIFFGTGEAAGSIAGRTRHTAEFHILLPKR